MTLLSCVIYMVKLFEFVWFDRRKKKREILTKEVEKEGKRNKVSLIYKETGEMKKF